MMSNSGGSQQKNNNTLLTVDIGSPAKGATWKAARKYISLLFCQIKGVLNQDITCIIGKSRRKTLTSCFVVGSGNLQLHAS